MDDVKTHFSTVTKIEQGKIVIYPKHENAKHWQFSQNEKDEASLAHYIHTIAEKNNLNTNDVSHMFPAILRMLKSKSVWAE